MGVVDGETASKKDSERFKKFWPADVHMIGKEIIRFHAVYWPAFLMAAFPDKLMSDYMPGRIQAHGWLLFEQEKMSKSKGNVAYAEPIVRALGNDALRYYLLREVVFGQDGNFSKDALITRYNADLANGLGNLASRTLTIIERSFQGAIPPIEAPPESTLWSKDDLGVTLAKNHAPEAVQVAQAAFERFDFSAYVSAVWQLISQVDQFLAIAKPWSVKEQHDLQAILYRAAETLRIAVVLAHPR